MEKLYSVEAAGAAANLCFTSVYRAISNGHLAKTKRGARVFISESALTAWLKGGAKTQPTKKATAKKAANKASAAK